MLNSAYCTQDVVMHWVVYKRDMREMAKFTRVKFSHLAQNPLTEEYNVNDMLNNSCQTQDLVIPCS